MWKWHVPCKVVRQHIILLACSSLLVCPQFPTVNSIASNTSDAIDLDTRSFTAIWQPAFTHAWD